MLRVNSIQLTFFFLTEKSTKNVKKYINMNVQAATDHLCINSKKFMCEMILKYL